MRYLNMYDSISCLNCLACMSACSMENRMRMERDEGITIERGVNEYLPRSYYLRPWRREVGEFPNARLLVAFEHCRHCEFAQCLIHCPAEAIERRPTGQVVINASACIGCRTCRDACPFNIPFYDKQTGKAGKCIGCYDRVEAGMKPACVSACPSEALISGPEDEVIAEGARIGGVEAELRPITAIKKVEDFRALAFIECSLGALALERGDSAEARQHIDVARQLLHLVAFDRAPDGEELTVTEVDFHGNTPEHGQLERAFVHNGPMWAVWLHYYPETELKIADMTANEIWNRYVRYIGAGAVATAGLITLVKSIPVMLASFRMGAAQLTQRFGAQDGHKYINALLDRASEKLRGAEHRSAADRGGWVCAGKAFFYTRQLRPGRGARRW